MTDARRPSRWEWIAAARAIRDGRTEPPEPRPLSAELAAEPGAQRGDDPINDRMFEAQEWCERIMKAEGRERLLAQYFSTDSEWLVNRLRGVLDDLQSWSPSNRPRPCFTVLGMGYGPGYGRSFGTGLDMSEPRVRAGYQANNGSRKRSTGLAS